MSLKSHMSETDTYNATPKRIAKLAKHLSDYLRAKQSQSVAQHQHFTINPRVMAEALEAYVDAGSYSSKAIKR